MAGTGKVAVIVGAGKKAARNGQRCASIYRPAQARPASQPGAHPVCSRSSPVLWRRHQ